MLALKNNLEHSKVRVIKTLVPIISKRLKTMWIPILPRGGGEEIKKKKLNGGKQQRLNP